MTKHKLGQLNSLIGEMQDAERRQCKNTLSPFGGDDEGRQVREQTVQQLMVWIQDIPDSLTRRAMQLRYVDGLPWCTIAMRMGYRSEDTPRKMCERYLEKTAGAANAC